MKRFILSIVIIVTTSLCAQQVPTGFVHLATVDSSIQKELRYITNNNFIGKPIDGYLKNTVIVSRKTAKALQKVQQQLRQKNLSLKIFDAYRPQQAVDHFVRWARVLGDTLMKQGYYPNVPKSELFEQGYIAAKSGHTRGSTVDLTIVDIETGEELDMGSPYDFFGEQSHPHYSMISEQQKKNRMLLRNIMLANGFSPYENEWWHFTLKDEPFPKTYFNFPIE